MLTIKKFIVNVHDLDYSRKVIVCTRNRHLIVCTPWALNKNSVLTVLNVNIYSALYWYYNTESWPVHPLLLGSCMMLCLEKNQGRNHHDVRVKQVNGILAGGVS